MTPMPARRSQRLKLKLATRFESEKRQSKPGAPQETVALRPSAKEAKVLRGHPLKEEGKEAPQMAPRQPASSIGVSQALAVEGHIAASRSRQMKNRRYPRSGDMGEAHLWVRNRGPQLSVFSKAGGKSGRILVSHKSGLCLGGPNPMTPARHPAPTSPPPRNDGRALPFTPAPMTLRPHSSARLRRVSRGSRPATKNFANAAEELGPHRL